MYDTAVLCRRGTTFAIRRSFILEFKSLKENAERHHILYEGTPFDRENESNFQLSNYF